MNSRPTPFNVRGARIAFFALSAATLVAQRMELADSSADAVVVETAAIRTEVTGRLAVTTFDLVFRNPNARVLEGTFSFPLLDGQSVVRFALEVNGALREAVPIEKTRGRVVFEEIQRRRVDPGLLEQTAGNNYRARVYPIPAHGTRRIVLAYQEDIGLTSGPPMYRLALDFPARLQKLALAIVVHTGGTAGAVAKSTLPFALPAWREGRFMDVEQTDVAARGLLELALPPLDAPRVLTGHKGVDEYFYAEVPLDVPRTPRPMPRVVGLLWDSSGSGRTRDHVRELAMLGAWFQRVPDVDVRLWRLRDRAESGGAFAIRGGDWQVLRAELERTAYDGATSLDGLRDDPAIDEWLLFSDGLVNYGVTPANQKLPLRKPVHVVLAAPHADPAWLRGLAAKHAGEFVNLLGTAPERAAERLRTHSPRVLGVDYSPHQVIEVFPEAGTPVADGPVIVTGMFRGARGTIALHVGTSERDARTIELTVHAGENPSPLAARGWALAKISHLAQTASANRADIRRTSRDFGIVAADTSLIVLETVADYVHYDVTPPDELRREWAAMRRSIASVRRKDRDRHMEQVLAGFEQRVEWWERSFPKETAPPAAPLPRKVRFGTATAPQLGAAAGPQARAATLPTDPDVVVLQPFTVSTERKTMSFAAASASSQRARESFEARGSAGTTRGAASAEPTAEPIAPTITLERWKPDSGYLERLERAAPGRAYAIYLEERSRHERQPGFFLDVANFFLDRADVILALRILSNLAELELEDAALLRTLAHRLVQIERAALAVPLFERVLALRPDEPQSRRDLALACVELKQHQRAIDLLWGVVSQPWDRRFPQIEQIALAELNAIVATCDEALDVSRIEARLLRNLPVETRVVLTWDANDCDVDLWVTDPDGERASYQHRLTYQGGRMSEDYTGGYGPEEFVLRRPKPGAYRVQIEYFADARQTALGPVTAQVRLVTGFGTRAQKEQRITVRLDERKRHLDVGSFHVGGERVSQR